MRHYQHLNKEERFYIWNALRTGSSQKEVALSMQCLSIYPFHKI